MNLKARVRRAIQRHQLAGPETRVVAALSGGPDSVALVHLLLELHQAGDLRLVGVAHFNHQLRDTAERDARFCAGVASACALPFVEEAEDVGALARHRRKSLEDTARTARHGFLERARAQLDADVVALGHTRNDQAETFLLRLIRGAGPKGLASMHPRAGRIIRPLLELRRGDVLQYLASRNLSYVTDESNADVSIPRNRVRAELLPLLEQRFNPSIVDVLAGEAEMARDEYWHLKAEADAWWARFGRRDGLRHVFDAEAMKVAPVAVARTILRRVMAEAAAGRSVAFDDVERALELARGHGTAFDGPGQRVERIGADLVLTGRPVGAVGRPVPSRQSVNLFRYSLSVPGEVQLPEVGRTLSAEVVSSGEWQSLRIEGADTAAMVQFEGRVRHLGVRNRRPGDRFEPFGLGRRKKLQDFLVDRKVAREQRDVVPIVVDVDDRIVWVAGHTIDRAFRVTDPAQSVIILRLKGVGGSA